MGLRRISTSLLAVAFAVRCEASFFTYSGQQPWRVLPRHRYTLMASESWKKKKVPLL